METIDLKRKAEEANLDEDDDYADNIAVAKSKHLANEKEKANMARMCPYLDTIDRNVLDFGMFVCLFLTKKLVIKHDCPSCRFRKALLGELI